MEEKKLLNKVIIFVFFSHKKYSRSLITLRLNNIDIDYFNDVLTTFLGFEHFSCFAVCDQKALRFYQKYLNLCSEDERFRMKVLQVRNIMRARN